jgi:U3 small nucleolar RNA-associated protein 21
MVTVHKDTASAYVWKFKHRVVTEMVLKQPHWQENSRKFLADRRTHATAVALSPCGNFCVVGTRGGALYKYNLQSGLPRGAFPQCAVDDATQSVIAKKALIPGNIYHDTKVSRFVISSSPWHVLLLTCCMSLIETGYAG